MTGAGAMAITMTMARDGWHARGFAGYSSAACVAQGIRRGMSQMRVKSKVGPKPFDSHLIQNASNASQIKCGGWSD